MIVDVFMFDDEFDMLDCRLYELSGVVDVFIAVEADHSFTGIPKEYHLSNNLNRYPDAPIEVVKAKTGDVEQTRLFKADWIYRETYGFWKREWVQRSAANHILDAMPSQTVAIFGDLDEIPKREVVASYDPTSPAVLRMKHLIYSTTLAHPRPWNGSVMGTLAHLGDPPSARLDRAKHRIIDDAGWHLSWFGEPEQRTRKMAHSAHQELGLADEVGVEYPTRHIHVDGTPLVPYEGDLPRWVRDGHAPAHWTQDW